MTGSKGARETREKKICAVDGVARRADGFDCDDVHCGINGDDGAINCHNGRWLSELSQLGADIHSVVGSKWGGGASGKVGLIG